MTEKIQDTLIDDVKPFSPVKKLFFTLFLALFLGLSVFLLWVSNHYVVPIMMYHHIAVNPDDRADTVSPENFAYQMRFIDENDYRVISLDEYTKRKKQKNKFNRNTVVITFDDGYSDFYETAYPILKQYDYPVTVFMPAGQVDEDGYLTEQQILELKDANVSFASHGVLAEYLPNVSIDKQYEEIQESKHILEGILKSEVKYYAYPVGGFSEQIKEIIKESGYHAAFTTNRGYDRWNQDLFELKRIRFDEQDNQWWSVFWKLNGYYNSTRKAKSPY